MQINHERKKPDEFVFKIVYSIILIILIFNIIYPTLIWNYFFFISK